MKAFFQKKHHLGSDLWIFYFKPKRPLRYVAGQFVEIVLPLSISDDRGSKRWFTLCSSPTEDFLAVTTRIDPKHPSSFKAHLASLLKGDEILISEAMGDFVLPKDTTIPLVFIATGVGVTPYRSIITSLIDLNESRSIEFLYAAARTEDIIFSKIFKSYDLILVTLINQRVNVRLLQHYIKNLDKKLVYVSGPEPVVEVFVNEIKRTKLQLVGLVTDYFHNYET